MYLPPRKMYFPALEIYLGAPDVYLEAPEMYLGVLEIDLPPPEMYLGASKKYFPVPEIYLRRPTEPLTQEKTLRAALADYRIHGAAGLQEAIERAVGKLTVHYLRAKKQGGAVNLDQLDRLLDLIIKVEALFAKAHVYLPALAEYLPKLLGA